MSGSTRAPDPASPGAEDRSLERGRGGVSGRGDAYVGRLGDRLTASLPPPPGPVPRRPLESSDVRPMPPEEPDDASDFPPLEPDQPADAFAEFEEEDELPAENTEIDGRDALLGESTQMKMIYEDAPPMPVLFVEAGRDQGREYVLVEGETTVGRGIDNEVILADVSVSRRHLKIVREGDILVLRDLGSGNGTMVNGHRVTSATLADGDRIELGETVLVVRVPGADVAAAAMDPEPVRANDPDHTTDESVPPGVYPGFSAQAGPAPESAWSVPPPSGQLPPPMSTSAGWLPAPERSGTIVLDRRTLLLSAGGIAVGASVLGALVVAVVLRGVGASQPVVSSTLPLETAPVQAPLGAVPPAAVPPGVASAPLAMPVPAGTAPPSAVAAGAVPSGTVPTGTVPPAPVPPPTPTPTALATAAPGAPEVERSPANAATPPAPGEPARAAAEPEPPRAGRSRAARPTRLPRRVATAEARPAPVSEAVLNAYRSGDFAGAVRQARAAGQVPLAGQIEQFATQSRAAQSAPRGSAQAISALERAIALDAAIVRGGHHGTRLRQQLVSAYLDSAQAAMRDRPQDACRSVQLAQRHAGASGGTNPRLGALARQCETQAQALVGQAAGLERSDPARARTIYRSVLPMVPSSSPSYTRARQRIDALARAQAVDEDE